MRRDRGGVCPAKVRCRGFLGIVIGLLSGCDPRPSPVRVREDAQSPPAFPDQSAATAPVSSAPEARKDEPASDPAFEDFSQALLRRCEAKDDEGTTASMVSAAHATGRCLRSALSKQFRKLPARTRAELAIGPPDPIVKDEWSPAWLRLVDSVCGVSDADAWVSGIRRMAGSMRYIESAVCHHAPLMEAAYLFLAYQNEDASAFATRVRATAPGGRSRLEAIRRALSNVETARLLAPEDSLFNDECWHCVLSDADWRRMALRLRAIDQESKALGTAVCNLWPELQARLGEHCATGVQEHFASYVGSAPTRLGQGLKADDYRDLPPPKDAAYRRIVDPVIDDCRPHENLHYSDVRYERKYLECLKKHRKERAANGISPKADLAWERFERRLCNLEDKAYSTELVAPVVDRLERLVTVTVEGLECPAITEARRIFFLQARADDDAKGFVEHAAARSRWLAMVEKGKERVEKVSKAHLCADTEVPAFDECRSPRLKAASWTETLDGFEDLVRESTALGQTVCDEWPSLRAQEPACAKLLRDYFLSYPTLLGLVAVNRDR